MVHAQALVRLLLFTVPSDLDQIAQLSWELNCVFRGLSRAVRHFGVRHTHHNFLRHYYCVPFELKWKSPFCKGKVSGA